MGQDQPITREVLYLNMDKKSNKYPKLYLYNSYH